MHLAHPSVPPEKQAELDDLLTVYNFSDVDFVAKFRGKTYRVKKMSTREFSAAACYLWFGDPGLRSATDAWSAMLWEREVNRIKHRFFVGNEADPENLFFNKYIRSGLIGCRQVLQRFVQKTNLHINPDRPPMDQLRFVANQYYGKILLQDETISDGGVPVTEGDVTMFSEHRLSGDESVKAMTDTDVLNFAASTFGSASIPTVGVGGYDTSMDPRAFAETASRCTWLDAKGA